MVFVIDKTTNEQDLQAWLNKVRNNRTKVKKPNLSKYFGVLPNIGDGLQLQKKIRDEWTKGLKRYRIWI
jgi:hypothetical protein